MKVFFYDNTLWFILWSFGLQQKQVLTRSYSILISCWINLFAQIQDAKNFLQLALDRVEDTKVDSHFSSEREVNKVISCCWALRCILHVKYKLVTGIVEINIFQLAHSDYY